MNDILTSTVASLFIMHRNSHLKFFKNSSELNESRNEIPIGRTSTTSLNMNEEQINEQQWVKNQGRKFLEDSVARLQIDTKKFTFKEQIISTISLDELNKIKRNVKNELKKYDQSFVSNFYRPPEKADKEPLRPLYMYYKRLKQLIQKKS